MKIYTELTRLLSARLSLSLMRRLNGILLSTEQLRHISSVVKERTPCRFLVFGLGKDSEYWSLLNKDGVTVFLEDSASWLDRITGRSENIKAFKVQYDTKRSDWAMLIERPDLLDMPLPDEVRAQKWDMILVDGPKGYKDHEPGRMKSIFLASELIGNPGDVFVHDCERIVENVYCNKFIGKEYLNKEISGRGGLLRHYRIFH